MAAKASPTLIGTFVLGGVLLLVGALFLFGSGDLFKEKRQWVTYFEGSVGGLTEGAPVNFRGVRVGTVTKVVLLMDTQAAIARIPVYFEVEPDRVSWVGGRSKQSTQAALDAGLRAKLSMQSLVTGQMQIELDILPDTPAKLVGADPNVPEIPSAQSDFDVLKRQLTDLPLQDLVASMARAVDSIDRVVNSPELKDSLRALASTLNETHDLVAAMNQDARPLVRELTAAAQSTRQTSQQAGTFLQSLQTDLGATLGDVRALTNATRTDLRATLRSADQALQQARTTLASIDGIVADDTRSRSDIDNALQNLAQASSSLRSFADAVERNPNAIFVGR